jgi:hypothetical protein
MGSGTSGTGIPSRENDGAAAGGPAAQLSPPAAAPLPPPGLIDQRHAGAAAVRERRLWETRNRFPRWHVWTDDEGWHCMRRGNFRHSLDPDAPAHSLHEADFRVFAVHLKAEDELEIPAGDWQL